MNQPYLSWVEVDLDAIAFNISGLKRYVGDKVLVGAVVKGNAYGHGAVEVSRAALASGADWAIVNRSNEGVELRQAGITAPLLVLGYLMPEEAERVVRWDLTPTVSDVTHVEALSKAAGEQGKVVNVHLKVDTGLGRQGVMPNEALDFARWLVRVPNLRMEGMYSHFAVADEGAADSVEYTRKQFDTYMAVRKQLLDADVAIPISHIANSAATLNSPEMHLDMVRCGSAVGGIYPSGDVKRTVPLRPALALKSHVARIKDLPGGSAISYGRTYVTKQDARIALIPVGYGDGYRRGLSNVGCILVRGRRAPIVGRICMDQCMIDVTGIPGVQLHDEAVLIGAQGDEWLSGEEVGALVGTNAYDITTTLAPRIPRVYIQNAAVLSVRDLVNDPLPA